MCSMSSSSIDYDEDYEKYCQTYPNGRNNNLFNLCINNTNYFISEVFKSNNDELTQNCLFSNADIYDMIDIYGFTDHIPLLICDDHIYCLIFSLEAINGYYYLFDIKRHYHFEYNNYELYLSPYKIIIKSEMFKIAKNEFMNFYSPFDKDKVSNIIKQNQHIIEQTINDNEARLINVEL